MLGDFADDPPAVAQSARAAPDGIRDHVLDPVDAVEKPGEFTSDQHRQTRARKRGAYRAQGRQAHHEIAEPVDLFDQYAADDRSWLGVRRTRGWRCDRAA